MRKAFTMIELIFVIVILGILAAVAIPKFVGVTDDAKIAAEQGVAGGVRGAIATMYGKALVVNPTITGGSATITSGNVSWTVNSNLYPISLDENNATTVSATAVTSSATNPLFKTVLNDPITDGSWKRNASSGTNVAYKGPASASASLQTNSAGLATTGAWVYAQDGTFQYSATGQTW